MKKHKNKILTGIIIALILAFSFWYGGNAPDTPKQKNTKEPSETVVIPETKQTEHKETTIAQSDKTDEEPKETITEAPPKQTDMVSTEENKPKNTNNIPITPDSKEETTNQPAVEIQSPEIQNESTERSEEAVMITDEATGKDKYLTDPVPEGKPLPVEPQDTVISDKELTCTLSVRCDTILDNMEWLNSEKAEIVPKDGVIFAEKAVTFYEGESVFNLLLREMKRNKIHMEFEDTPIYNSAYIEGIANIYEFDCGELSGWMYKVNDWFPNYGCSRYQLKAGDKVEWLFTCNLGADVGGYNLARREKQ